MQNSFFDKEMNTLFINFGGANNTIIFTRVKLAGGG